MYEMRTVKKIGGTSIGKHECRENFLKNVTKGDIIIVSALSPTLKKYGSTNLLIEYFRESNQESLKKVKKNYEDILKYYNINLNIDRFFIGIEDKSLDDTIGIGEILSTIVITEILNRRYNIKSESCVFDNIITDDFEKFIHILKQKIKLQLENQKIVHIVSGFFGKVPGGIVKKIGRGYSDYLGALITNELECVQTFELWKEAYCIMSIDPRYYPNPLLIENITPMELIELSNNGSEVVHNRVIEILFNPPKNKKIVIKNCSEPHLKGTFIDFIQTDRPKILSIQEHIYTVSIKSGYSSIDLHYIMKKLVDHHIKPLMICISETTVSLAVSEVNDSFVKELHTMEVYIENNVSMVSIIGEGMRNKIGIAGLIMKTLSVANVNIKMISQIMSEIIISMVIDNQSIHAAIDALHKNIISKP